MKIASAPDGQIRCGGCRQLKLRVERRAAQVSGALDALEQERAAVKTPYWFGERIGHSDAVACVLRFTAEAHPHLYNATRYPALSAHAAHCGALPPFKENRAAAGAPEGVRLVLQLLAPWGSCRRP